MKKKRIVYLFLMSIFLISCGCCNYSVSKKYLNNNEERLVKLIKEFQKDKNIYSLEFTKQEGHYLLNDRYESIYSVYPPDTFWFDEKGVGGKHLNFESEEELLNHAGVKKERILYWKERFEEIGITGLHRELSTVYFVYILPMYGLIYIKPEEKQLIELQKKGKKWMIFEEVKQIRDNWFYFFAND